LGFGLVSYAGSTITLQSTADQIGVPILAFTFNTEYLHENKHLNTSKEHFRGPSGYPEWNGPSDWHYVRITHWTPRTRHL